MWTRRTYNPPTGITVCMSNEAGVVACELAENAAWGNLEWAEALDKLSAKTDVVCCGTHGQRTHFS